MNGQNCHFHGDRPKAVKYLIDVNSTIHEVHRNSVIETGITVVSLAASFPPLVMDDFN